MATEKVESKLTSIKMKYVGHFRGTEKRVALLDKELIFSRTSDRNGPAFCDVPMEWAGALIQVGGNWQVVDKLTPDAIAAIGTAHDLCEERMKKFILENELVDA